MRSRVLPLTALALALGLAACKAGGDKCAGPGAGCNSDAQCCSGYVCTTGVCAPPGDVGGRCANENQRCADSSDCCGVLTCNANRVCTGGICQGRFTPCTDSGQCCGTLSCIRGSCQ